VVGIVLRSLDELERVLLVVREVAILRMLPLRAVSLFADTAYYPPFSFTTSVHSFEVCAAYSRVFPFNTEVHGMFVEVAIKSEGGDGGRKILPPPSLPIEPPTPTPNPQLPPSEPEPPPIIPTPTPTPTPTPPPPGNGNGGSVIWNVKLNVYVTGYNQNWVVHIVVTRNDGNSIQRHYEQRTFTLQPGGEPLGKQITVLGVSVTKESLTKTWNVKIIGLQSGRVYVDMDISITVPPFNGQSEPSGVHWDDDQTHIV
jgi:hypothetical protein